MEVASRIVVMNGGRIEQQGTPDEVYEHPATPFVSGFLGSVNLFHGRVQHGWTHIGAHRVPAPQDCAHGATTMAYVRPHELEVSRTAGGALGHGEVQAVRRLGALVRLEIDSAAGGNGVVEVEMTRERYAADPCTVGDRVFLHARTLRLFAADGAVAEAAVPEPAIAVGT